MNILQAGMTAEDKAQLDRIEGLLNRLVSYASHVGEYNAKLRAENERAFQLNDRIEAVLPKLEKLAEKL